MLKFLVMGLVISVSSFARETNLPVCPRLFFQPKEITYSDLYLAMPPMTTAYPKGPFWNSYRESVIRITRLPKQQPRRAYMGLKVSLNDLKAILSNGIGPESRPKFGLVMEQEALRSLEGTSGTSQISVIVEVRQSECWECFLLMMSYPMNHFLLVESLKPEWIENIFVLTHTFPPRYEPMNLSGLR